MKPRQSKPVVSPARSAAFDVLLRVERDASYASDLLRGRDLENLSTADHALATELVMGVLRWRSMLDSQIISCITQPFSRLDLEVILALRLGVYQLRRLTRVPAHAAINESVELVKRARKRSAAPFVNAVLHKVEKAGASLGKGLPEDGGASAENIARNLARPPWLVERWTREYGLEITRHICAYDQSVPVTGIRLRSAEAETELRAEGIELHPGNLLASARTVRDGELTRTRAFRDGHCVIQDEASQLVAALAQGGTRVLDCCAAPGGKALAIADRDASVQVTAVELHSHRARMLKSRLDVKEPSSAATANIQVLTGDARALPFAGNFDRVLADVPCSGTGTLARNPEIRWRLKPEDLDDLQGRQLAILTSAMAQVSTGGRMIYSTCSLEPEENEHVVERALAADSSFRILECGEMLEQLKASGDLAWADPASLVRGKFLRMLPGVHPCDGFLAAILQKR